MSFGNNVKYSDFIADKYRPANKMYINTEETKALPVTGKRLQHKLSEEAASLKLRLDATNIDQLSHHNLQGLRS